MLAKISKTLLCGVLALLLSVSTAVSAEYQFASLPGNIGEYWTPISTSLETETSFADLPTFDEEVVPAQMLAPQPRSPRTALRPRRSAVARRNVALASVPFMIGDTGAGSCVSFGNLVDAELAHPTLGCSRLNVSESNTPLPTDRVYFSYRHFANATATRVFSNFEDFDVGRFTFGGERTYFEGMMSVEIRLPLENRLSSEIGTSIVQFDPPFIPGSVPGINPITNGRQIELANISMIFKALLIEQKDYAVSAGLGVTLPTAQDVRYDATIETFVIRDIVTFDQVSLSTIAANETVYLAPFLSWLWTPTPRFFHQGFLQIEVAANPSRIHAVVAGVATADLNGDTFYDRFDPTDGTISYITPSNPLVGFGPGLASTEIQPQTLLRLNLGCGYVLSENSQADWIQKLTSIFEIHYTTTLNDAKINEIPLDLAFNGVPFPSDDPIFDGVNSIDVGNRNNRVDIVNVVAGLTANMGNWVVTNGVTAPIRSGSDRGFDFEYNLQLQRPF